MAIKPILFNAEMCRAVLDGRKTVTRRVVKQNHVEDVLTSPARRGSPEITDRQFIELLCEPPCSVGDILWVRETWCKLPVSHGGNTRLNGAYYYKADGDLRPDGWSEKWHPSIHMPKKAARTFLRVTGVRVDRLQEITGCACRKEGIQEWTKDGNLVKYYPADCEGDAPACEWQKCPRSL